MLKAVGIPLQVLEEGVTVKDAMMGMLLVLFEVKMRLLADPVAPIPIPVFVFDQLKVVLATRDPPKDKFTVVPAHSILSAIGVMLGVGFTRTVKILAIPLHPLLKGVTENSELIGTL
jgi:hypothetical protein